MDAFAFDRLTRALATGGTRRRLLAVLGLIPLATTTLLPQAEPAEAGGRRHRHKRRHHPGGDKRHRKGKQKGKQKGQHKGQHQQAPPPPLCESESQTTTCAEQCGTVLNTCGEPVDCGPCTCATGCPPCQTCNTATGQCEPVADGMPCDDGDACTTNDACQGGVCTGTLVTCEAPPVCRTTADATCETGQGTCTYPTLAPDMTDCGSGQNCCGGDCADLQTDPDHCGTCGNACGGATPGCVDGVCVSCDVCTSGCPFATVQAAIDAASDGDTIVLCAGSHGRSAGNSVADIHKSVTLAGVGQGGDGTILDGGNTVTPNPVVQIIDAPMVVLRDLTVKGGDIRPNGYGGGVYVARSTVMLTRVQVTDNYANFGGGFHNNAELTLTDCTVTHNSAVGYAGGIFNAGRLTLNDTTVTQNTGRIGGGIVNGVNGTLVLDADSSVSDNTGGNCINAGGTGCPA